MSTRTQEDLYFQIAVTALSYNDRKPNFTVDIDGRDSVTYHFDKRNKQTMEFTFPAKSLDFASDHSLNITLLNHPVLTSLYSGETLIESAGLEIINIAAIFLPSKRQYSIPTGFGQEDTTGRNVTVPPLAPHIVKFGDQVGFKFWLNGDVLNKEAKFHKADGSVQQCTGKNFRMTQNGTFKLSFRSPIPYWILQRFYVVDK